MSKVALMCGHGKSVDGSWDSGCAYGGYTEAALMLPITKGSSTQSPYVQRTRIISSTSNSKKLNLLIQNPLID